MLNYISGDATRPIPVKKLGEVAFIAHICNDAGLWGSGFVLAVSKRWSKPEAEYRALKARVLGSIQIVPVDGSIAVVNMIAQHGVRSATCRHPLDLQALTLCLKKVAIEAKKHNASIHMPRIGCGLGGGDWRNEVLPIIEQELSELEINVYDP